MIKDQSSAAFIITGLLDILLTVYIHSSRSLSNIGSTYVYILSYFPTFGFYAILDGTTILAICVLYLIPSVWYVSSLCL